MEGDQAAKGQRIARIIQLRLVPGARILPQNRNVFSLSCAIFIAKISNSHHNEAFSIKMDSPEQNG
jgi:hypothetical protein